MKIAFEIDDALVPSIEQWLNTQIRVENDPLTGAQKMIRVHADVPSFLADTLHQVVHQTVMQFPPDCVREQMAAAKQINDRVKAAMKPKVMVGDPGNPGGWEAVR